MNKQALWEAVKEILRVGVLAVIPVIIGYLATSTFDPTIVTVGTLVLRFLDKFLYEKGKLTNNTTLEGGLTRF